MKVCAIREKVTRNFGLRTRLCGRCSGTVFVRPLFSLILSQHSFNRGADLYSFAVSSQATISKLVFGRSCTLERSNAFLLPVVSCNTILTLLSL